jgi:hypothetical protein
MSTKIYYGYKYNGTMEELFKDLVPIRDKYREQVKDLYTLCIERTTVDDGVCDIKDIGFNGVRGMKYKEFDEYHWVGFFEAWIKRGLKEALNTLASIMIFPFEDSIYLIPYINQEYDGSLHEMEGIRDRIEYFGYWNNTDPDENCSEEEWDERARIWDAILGYSPVRDYGFVFEIYDISDVWRTVMDVRLPNIVKGLEEMEEEKQ